MEEPNSIYIIGFEEITAKEDPGNGRCIWCNQTRKFNIAHILSKKIIRINNPQNVLKRSVCVSCNSYFGNKIEDWFYKYSPLGTWANQLNWPKDGFLTNLKYVPNFLWNDKLKEWIVIHHDKIRDILATQIILNSEDRLLTFHYDHSGKKKIEDIVEIKSSIKNRVISGNFSDYLDHKLPIDFSPRVLIFKDKLILMARSLEEKAQFINQLNDDDANASDYQLSYENPDIMEKMVIHYSWSLQRYFILSAKIGFEFLSLIKGQAFCQHPRFDALKKGINDAKFDKIVVPYIEGKGYQVNRLTPPGWVGYVKTAKNISGFPIMTSQKKDCHSVFIYSVKGYLLFDVRLFALEPCQLLIAKDCDLDEVYHIEYDLAEQTLRFFHMLKSRVDLDQKLDLHRTLDTIKTDNHLAMVTLRDLSPPSLLQ